MVRWVKATPLQRKQLAGPESIRHVTEGHELAFESGKLIGDELGDWAVVEQAAMQIGIERPSKMAITFFFVICETFRALATIAIVVR